MNQPADGSLVGVSLDRLSQMLVGSRLIGEQPAVVGEVVAGVLDPIGELPDASLSDGQQGPIRVLSLGVKPSYERFNLREAIRLAQKRGYLEQVQAGEPGEVDSLNQPSRRQTLAWPRRSFMTQSRSSANPPSDGGTAGGTESENRLSKPIPPPPPPPPLCRADAQAAARDFGQAPERMRS